MKVSYMIGIVLSILSTVNFNAQEAILEGYTPIDSLVHKDYNTLRDYFLKKLPLYNIEPDSILAHHIAMTYLWKAYQTHDTLNIGKGYNYLGVLENFRIDYFDKAIFYTKNRNDRSYPAVVYRNKAYSYSNSGDYIMESKMLIKAIEYAKHLNNSRLLNDYEYYINVIDADWGDKELAIEGFNDILLFVNSMEYNKIYPDHLLADKERKIMDIHYNLAKTHYEIGSHVIALKHLDTIHAYDKKNKTDIYKTEYLGLKSAIYYRQKKYKEALELTDEYLKYIPSDELYSSSSSNIIKGLTLWELNRKEEAIQAIKKADSLYQISGDIYEELGEGYQLLINHYKETGDTENQLQYLNKLIAFDREISSNYIEIGNRIEQEYTIPELLSAKEDAIKNLNKANVSEKSAKRLFLSLLVLVSMLTTFFIYRSYKNKKKFRSLILQFETSINQKAAFSKPEPVAKKQESQELDEKQVLHISKGLEHFETTKGYLDDNVTLQSLAKLIETNSSYLSKYINTVKGSNFSKYVNTLRVNHAIYRLQSDPKFRIYTIEAMASEVGFSNMRSFTNYFKKETGLTVSYFIKNLKKI